MCDESRVKRSFPPKFPPTCWVCNAEFGPEDKNCPGCGRDLNPAPYIPPVPYAEDGLRDFGADGRRW